MKKRKLKINTVGQLQDELLKYKRNTKIQLRYFVDCRPDGGSYDDCYVDLSGDEDCDIQVTDFGSGIVIEKFEK